MPGGSPEIRPASADDEPAVLELWREVFPEYAAATHPHRDPVASVRRKLAHGDGLFFVAEQGGRVVGTIMAGWDGHRGWLYSLAVHPGARRGGLGRALVRHAERALAERGCPKVNLQVYASNAAARAFWAAVGYAEDPVVSLGKRLG